MANLSYRVRCLAQKINACNVCGTSEDLVVHHINGDREDDRLENLVPLCRECHGQVHSTSNPEGVVQELQSKLPDTALSFTDAPADNTLLRVSNDLADELYDHKQRGESYEDVMWRLIEQAEGGTDA